MVYVPGGYSLCVGFWGEVYVVVWFVCAFWCISVLLCFLWLYWCLVLFPFYCVVVCMFLLDVEGLCVTCLLVGCMWVFGYLTVVLFWLLCWCFFGWWDVFGLLGVVWCVLCCVCCLEFWDCCALCCLLFIRMLSKLFACSCMWSLTLGMVRYARCACAQYLLVACVSYLCFCFSSWPMAVRILYMFWISLCSVW